MNQTTDSLPNPTRKEDIQLDLLVTKVIISPGRYLLMTHNRLLPGLWLEVPTSGWTSQKGWIFYGRPQSDGSDEPPLRSAINFDYILQRTFLLPMDENGERKRDTISDHIHNLGQAQASTEGKLRFILKVDGELMEYLEDNFDTGHTKRDSTN